MSKYHNTKPYIHSCAQRFLTNSELKHQLEPGISVLPSCPLRSCSLSCACWVANMNLPCCQNYSSYKYKMEEIHTQEGLNPALEAVKGGRTLLESVLWLEAESIWKIVTRQRGEKYSLVFWRWSHSSNIYSIYSFLYFILQRGKNLAHCSHFWLSRQNLPLATLDSCRLGCPLWPCKKVYSSLVYWFLQTIFLAGSSLATTYLFVLSTGPLVWHPRAFAQSSELQSIGFLPPEIVSCGPLEFFPFQ